MDLSLFIERLEALYDKLKNHIVKYLGEEIDRNVRKRLTLLGGKCERLLRDELPINLVVAGEFSSGKSSVINSLIGEQLIPTGEEPMTSVPCIFKYGERKKILIEFADGNLKEIPTDEFNKIKHTTKEALETDYYKSIKIIHFQYPYPKLADINIIDTPGFNADHQNDDEKTIQVILNDADILLWVFDANQTAKGTEINIMQTIRSLFCFTTRNSDQDVSTIKSRIVDIYAGKPPVIAQGDEAETLVKKDIKILGLLNKIDQKGRPGSDKVRGILDLIKTTTGLETIIPYSARKVMEFRNIDTVYEGFVDILKNEKNAVISLTTDERNNKKITASSGDKVLLEKRLSDFNEWMASQEQLESLMEDIRKNSKEIFEFSLGKDLGMLYVSVHKAITEVMNRLLGKYNQKVNQIKQVINTLEYQKSFMEKDYVTYEENVRLKLENNLARYLFEIKAEKDILQSSQKSLIKKFSDISYRTAVESKIVKCFDYNNKRNEEVQKIKEIIDALSDDAVELNKSFPIFLASYSNIYNSGINISINSIFEIAEYVAEKKLDPDTSVDDCYRNISKELYKGSGIQEIFAFLSRLVVKYHDNIIHNLSNKIASVKEESQRELENLKQIKEELFLMRK